MRFHRFLGLFLLGAAASAQASITFVYSVGSAGFSGIAVSQDFESLGPKDTGLAIFSTAAVDYVANPGSNVFISSPGYANYGIAGATTTSILTANGDEDFHLDFKTTVRRVGFDVYTIDDPGSVNSVGGAPPVAVTVTTTSGSTVLNLPAPAGNFGFLGIVSDDAITRIDWYGKLGGVRNTGIDNLRTAEAVPEPATLAALGLGLAALARRRRARSS